MKISTLKSDLSAELEDFLALLRRPAEVEGLSFDEVGDGLLDVDDELEDDDLEVGAELLDELDLVPESSPFLMDRPLGCFLAIGGRLGCFLAIGTFFFANGMMVVSFIFSLSFLLRLAGEGPGGACLSSSWSGSSELVLAILSSIPKTN